MHFCIIISFLLFKNVYSELFTTYVNFEKYYLMEEELITLTDLIIQQERITHGEDVHGFLNISHIIDTAKAIHSDYGSDVEPYLSHPINTFHLSKRLASQWKNVVQQIMDTDTCVKALRVKLQNMEDNIPDDKQISKIAISILNLDKFYNISLKDLLSGEIDGHFPHEPFTLDDVVYIARRAYDEEQFHYAVTWLNHVVEEMKTRQLNTIGTDYTKSAIYNLLASAYFRINEIKNALKLTEEVLLFDPGNGKAVRHREFYSSLDPSRARPNSDKSLPTKKSLKLFRQLCNPNTVEKSSKGKCLYFPLRNKKSYLKSDIKAEVVKSKPLIVVFHNMINNKTANALKYIGHETILNLTSEHRYSYPRISSGIRDETHWGWISNLEKKFFSMDLSSLPARNSKFNVMNIGLDGFVQKEQKRKIDPVGSFIVSLSGKTVGGDLVFPLARTKVSLQKGDAIFYEHGTPFTICPVAYGTQWFAFQYLFEVPPWRLHCHPERRVRRGY